MKLLMLPMTLATFTPRTEKHGQDGAAEPASSLTLKNTLKVESLSQVFPTNDAAEAFIASVWDEEGIVRHGINGPISLDRELIGGSAKLVTPANEMLEFDEAVDIKNVSIHPLEGFIGELKMRFNCHPTDEQAGRIYSLQGKELSVTAQRAASDAEEAEAAGQKSLGLSTERKAE